MNLLHLPSVSDLLTQMSQTFARFYAAILTASVGTLAACIGIAAEKHLGNHSLSEQMGLFVLICLIGLSLFVAARMFIERRAISVQKGLLIELGVLVLLVLLRVWLPFKFRDFEMTHIYTCVALVLSSHLLVAYAPFIGRDEANGFWQYNKTFFLRFLKCLLWRSTQKTL